MVFRPCVSDHPEPHTPVTVAIGRGCLSMRTVTQESETREYSFKITRMRCWRIMKGDQPENGQQSEGMLKSEGSKLELSFEYLVTPEKLEWVRVVSSQAILMSMCLQSMVEELVRIRSGEKEPQRITRCSNKQRQSTKSHHINGGDQSPDVDEGCGGPVDYTVRRLAERFSVVNMKSASRAAEDVFVENEMFNTSGVSEDGDED